MFAKQFDPNALKNKPQGEATSGGGSSSGGGGGINVVQLIVILCTMSVINLGAIGAAIYFLGPVMLNPLVDKLIASAQPETPEGGEHGKEGKPDGEHGKEGEGHGEPGKEGAAHGEEEPSLEALASLGQNYKLDDFTVNLTPNPRSPSENQFLRAKMSLSFKVPDEENCLVQKAKHAHDKPAAGGEGGGHGGGAPAPEGEDPCEKAFKEKLKTFLPNIRDVINSSLMRRTANALSSVEGQEMLKDEMIEQLNTLVHPIEYSVLRINFEEFIVQR